MRVTVVLSDTWPGCGWDVQAVPMGDPPSLALPPGMWTGIRGSVSLLNVTNPNSTLQPLMHFTALSLQAEGGGLEVNIILGGTWKVYLVCIYHCFK